MKQLLIGLDLSFSCTGITIINMEDMNAKAIQFHRVLFDDQTTKKGFTVDKIYNINDTIYRMPANVSIYDIVYDFEDKSCKDQCEYTIQSMIASKKIALIIKDAIKKYQPDIFYVGIENYIMPSFGGKSNIKSVGSLISLQSMVREALIRMSLEYDIEFKLFTPSVKTIKAYFCGNGNGEKFHMVKAFFNDYEGNKLLPTCNITHVGKINDVVDSFAIAMLTFSKIFNKINMSKLKAS